MLYKAGNKRHGSVLLLVLIVLASVNAAAWNLAFRCRTGLEVLKKRVHERKCFYGALAGVERLKLAISESRDEAELKVKLFNFSGTAEREGVGLERGLGIGYMLRDKSAYLNINRAGEKLLLETGLSESETDKILDWIDSDDDRRSDGAEKGHYLSMEEKLACKNKAVLSLGELMNVDGVTGEMIWGSLVDSEKIKEGISSGRLDLINAGIWDYFGGDDDDSKINLNSVSVKVLDLLPGIDSGLASRFINHRAGPDGIAGTDDDVIFETVTDVDRLTFISDIERNLLIEYAKVESSGLRFVCCAAYEEAVCVLAGSFEMKDSRPYISELKRIF